MERKYPLAAPFARAIYSQANHCPRAWRENPLIAALQPQWTPELVANAMTYLPELDAEQRHLSEEERTELALGLLNIFDTQPRHLQLVTIIHGIIRMGLVGRDRLVHGHFDEVRRRVDTFAATQVGRLNIPQANGKSLLIHGLPGVGKTELMKRICTLMPQVIEHTHFGGERWPCRQIVWLRITLHSKATDRALCYAILAEIDRVTGSSYTLQVDRERNATTLSYLVKIAHAAMNHAIGLVIVDEIQLLRGNRESGDQARLSFLLNFNTVVGVPLIMVGTPACWELFSRDPRYMRRSEGLTDPEIPRFLFPTSSPAEYDRMLKDDSSDRDDWTNFVESFWRYQYLRHPIPLDYELSKALYDCCAGIIDYALKVFVTAQIAAMGDSERLDEAGIRRAYLRYFPLSQPYLEAVRDQNHLKLRQYDDFVRDDMKQVVAYAVAERQRQLQAQLRAALDAARRKAKQKPRTQPGEEAAEVAAPPSAAPLREVVGDASSPADAVDRLRRAGFIASPDELR